jgi:hypothetical protein
MPDSDPAPALSVRRRLQHLHQERVYWNITDQLEEKEVFGTFQPDGPEGREAQKQFGEPAGLVRVGGPGVLFQHAVNFLTQHLHFLHGLDAAHVCNKKPTAIRWGWGRGGCV